MIVMLPTALQLWSKLGGLGGLPTKPEKSVKGIMFFIGATRVRCQWGGFLTEREPLFFDTFWFDRSSLCQISGSQPNGYPGLRIWYALRWLQILAVTVVSCFAKASILYSNCSWYWDIIKNNITYHRKRCRHGDTWSWIFSTHVLGPHIWDMSHYDSHQWMIF